MGRNTEKNSVFPLTFISCILDFKSHCAKRMNGFFFLKVRKKPRCEFQISSQGLIKKGIVRNITIPSIGIVLATASFVCFNLLISELTAQLPGIFTGSVNPTAYIVAVLLYVVMITVNVIYKKKNIQVKYKDVSEFLLPYNERPSTIAKKAQNEA